MQNATSDEHYTETQPRRMYEPITERVGQPIRESLDQPITGLTTERENVYNKRFSQSSPSPDEDLQVAVETSRSF